MGTRLIFRVFPLFKLESTVSLNMFKQIIADLYRGRTTVCQVSFTCILSNCCDDDLKITSFSDILFQNTAFQNSTYISRKALWVKFELLRIIRQYYNYNYKMIVLHLFSHVS